MTEKPSHLVERAAERLLKAGMLDPPSAPPAAGAQPAATLAAPIAPAGAPGAVPGNGAAAAGVLDAPAPSAPVLNAPLPRSPAPFLRGDVSIVTMQALQNGGMIDWTHTRNRITEEFRIIRSQVLRASFAPQNPEHGLHNLVMLTSARPGEGKSFTSLNLAASIAQQNDYQVLLVDADAKPRSIGSLLGLNTMPGLMDLAADHNIDPAGLIVPTAIPTLSILPIGHHDHRSAELFTNRRTANIIQELGRRYADRIVIIDAPPALSSSDPANLAPIVGQIVVVVEADKTQREEVESTLDLVQACPSISLMLNKIQLSTKHAFGAYYYAYGS
jgi:receptor protein-tyrosine kinase